MAKKKTFRIGNLLNTKYEGKTLLSIGLGTKGKNSDYDNSVEVIVRNHKGEVVARQTDGFLNLVDVRKEPKDLFDANIIDEETFNKMQAGLENLSEKVKYSLRLSVKE